jgi:DNA-binding response OmpR family regulator
MGAVNVVRRAKPDLVILDYHHAGHMSGLEAARMIGEEAPGSTILVQSMHFSEELAREILHAGALGYVLKSDADCELLAAVDHVRRHQPFFIGQLATSMMQTFLEGTGPRPCSDDGAATLTPREERFCRTWRRAKATSRSLPFYRAAALPQFRARFLFARIKMGGSSGGVATGINRRGGQLVAPPVKLRTLVVS